MWIDSWSHRLRRNGFKLGSVCNRLLQSIEYVDRFLLRFGYTEFPSATISVRPQLFSQFSILKN